MWSSQSPHQLANELDTNECFKFSLDLDTDNIASTVRTKEMVVLGTKLIPRHIQRPKLSSTVKASAAIMFLSG